jgi:hypothetical protein
MRAFSMPMRSWQSEGDSDPSSKAAKYRPRARPAGLFLAHSCDQLCRLLPALSLGHRGFRERLCDQIAVRIDVDHLLDQILTSCRGWSIRTPASTDETSCGSYIESA